MPECGAMVQKVGTLLAVKVKSSVKHKASTTVLILCPLLVKRTWVSLHLVEIYANDDVVIYGL